MFRLTAAFMFLAATSAALAHTGVKNAQVMARMEAMEQIAAATKTLSEMAKRQIPFDAATAKAALSAIESRAQDIPGLFAPRADDPKSEALPAIWETPGDFARKAQDLSAAAKAGDVSDLDALRFSLRAIGTACSSCHETYRK